MRTFASRLSGLALAFGFSSTLLAACSDDPPFDEVPSGTGGDAASGGTTSGGTTSGGASGSTATGGGTGGNGTGGSATGGVTTGGSSTGGSATGGNSTGGAAGSAIGGSATGGSGTGGAAGSATGGSGGMVTGDRSTPEGTCARWNGDRADVREGTWSGNVASCTVGDISPEGRANALKLINLYRWLADLPAVATEASRDQQAQACALMMEAEGELSHSPGEDWTCYSAQGAMGASSSNISGGPGVSSIDAYMVDRGNGTTIGHRRWTLSNSLGPIGLGSTGTGASCFQNLRGSGRAGKQWMAWPPPGIVPLQAFGSGRSGTIDTTGWTVQSDQINLAGATVTVTAGGMNMPVTVTQLQGGYGSQYAFRFNPMGWTTAAGQTYAVNVTGISTPISYEVQVVSCAM
jgi:hypothetical protein